MKNSPIILIKTFICVFLIISFSGCWNRNELDTLGIVMGIGIDKAEESGQVKVTSQVIKPGEIGASKKGGGAGGGSDAFWNVVNTGYTVFGALRDSTNKTSRKLYFPHNQIILVGREIAEEGVRKYLDFFFRDPEPRVNVWILVSQGTAGEILDVKSEFDKVPASNIAKLIELEAKATSQTMAVRLRNFALGLMSKTTAPVAPFIGISDEGGKKVATISGTAVFKGDKLVGKLDKLEGRGLLWILGEVKSGLIEVEDSTNSKVCLEIIRAKSKMSPEIKNNKIIIKVNINEDGNLGEETGLKNLSKLEEVAQLEKKKSEAIKSEVMAAVKKAQELNADIFGFGEAIHQKYPKQWKELEDKWDEIFPTVQVEVKVQAKIRLMGRISKPAAPEQEKK
ncbi:MAG TPA: Ger(x)C family spore germination protein [Ruminiclostridium sp.]|nr:Ger(x)C family spore germination protein [Ruminiclostridium sp.]